MLPLPLPATDALRLADWLEIYALISADENSSRGDLERALVRGSIYERNADVRIEEKCLQVFFELEQRVAATQTAYPFVIDGTTLSVKPDRRLFASYLFCLGLSYFGWTPRRNAPINPRDLFEDISCIAAGQYIQGNVLRFGARGRASATSFRAAIDQLCQRVGEGIGFKEQATLARKDDKVDLVAWKELGPDRRSSKLVLFGQCASGADWDGKVSELQPKAFWDQWTSDGAISEHIKSFYIPHRIQAKKWDFYARKAGVVFDRCRIAYWSWQNNDAVLADPRYLEWFETKLSELR
jgi:hypothetical protein